MAKTQNPEPKQVPEDDPIWEFFKLLMLAGLPTLLLFYAFEVFMPFGAQQEFYRKRCDEAGGFVAYVNQEKQCIKKDGLIKIE